MKISKFLFGLVFILLFTTACQEPAPPMDEVSLQLKWIHQAQFAGYYVAKEKGFYEEQNIELTLVPGGIGIDPLNALETGAVDIAVAAPETLILSRDQEKDFKAVAVIYQTNPYLLITLADSGIDQLADFPGHTIGIANDDGRAQVHLMMRNAGLDPDTLIEKEFSFDYEKFYSGEIEIYPTFAAGSYLDIVREGVEVNKFWPDDYGVHWYSDTLVVNDEMIEDNPNLVERFLRATFKGMEYMIAHPEEAVEITMQYAEVQDEDVQRAMLNASIPLIYTTEPRIGWMDREKWFGMRQDMYLEGLIDELPNLDAVYTLQFLDRIYGDQQ